MKSLCSLVLYASLALGANAGMAQSPEILDMREGSLKKLVFTDPSPVSEMTFIRADGGEGTLSDFAGRHVLLNFWATWCAPCRKEMPDLSELQSELGGDDFQVVTIATGRNPEPAMVRFFQGVGSIHSFRSEPAQALFLLSQDSRWPDWWRSSIGFFRCRCD